MTAVKRRSIKKTEVKAYWKDYLLRLGKIIDEEELEEYDFCFACGFEYHMPDGKLIPTEKCHITPYWKSKNDEVSNIHLLCRRCHKMSEWLWGEDYFTWFNNQSIVHTVLYDACKKGTHIHILWDFIVKNKENTNGRRPSSFI